MSTSRAQPPRCQVPTYAEAYRAGFAAGRRGDRSAFVHTAYLATSALERAFAVGVQDGLRRQLRRAS